MDPEVRRAGSLSRWRQVESEDLATPPAPRRGKYREARLGLQCPGPLPLEYYLNRHRDRRAGDPSFPGAHVGSRSWGPEEVGSRGGKVQRTHLSPQASIPGKQGLPTPGSEEETQNARGVPFSTLRCCVPEAPAAPARPEPQEGAPAPGDQPHPAHLVRGPRGRRREPRTQPPRALPEPAPQPQEQRRRGRHLALTPRGPASSLSPPAPGRGRGQW